MKKLFGAGLILLLVIIMSFAGLSAGCGGTTTTTTVTAPPSTGTSGNSQNQGTTSGSASSSSTSLPKYNPSNVVSDDPGSLQLTTSDSLQSVTAFYDNELSKGGWSIISSSKTDYSTNITAKKGSTGTTLSVSMTGSGVYISLVTYPV